MRGLPDFLDAHPSQTVLVRVADAKGSTPRESGTVMAVAPNAIWGTIGGGRLEYEAIGAARRMLRDGIGPHDRHVMDRPLGPALNQCCGGRVKLELRLASARDAERAEGDALKEWTARPPVIVFGAGHVGQALARALAPLPLRTLVVDERPDAIRDLPQGMDWTLTPLPEAVIAHAEPGTCFVVMTHSHALDFAIARAALERGDAAYVGMIGSLTKRARFISAAAREGVVREVAERLICPMAPHARRDKRPEVIAAFVAAEVLGAALRARGAGAVTDRPLAQHRPNFTPA